MRKQLRNNPKEFSRKEIEQKKIIPYKNCIYLPIKLRKRVLDWYHHYLCHSGKTRMYKTLASTMYWEGTEKDINTYIKQYTICQKYKKETQKVREITS